MLREAHRPTGFESRVLRKIFGSKAEEAIEEERKLHCEEISDLYLSPNIIRVIKSRRIRWAGHTVCSDEKRNAYRILVLKRERKRPLRTLGIARMSLNGPSNRLGWFRMDFSGLANGQVAGIVNTVMTLRGQ